MAHYDVVEYLVSKGAEKESQNFSGLEPRDYDKQPKHKKEAWEGFVKNK
jgi:hypothetical protein